MHLSISGILNKISHVKPNINVKILELHNCQLDTGAGLLKAFSSTLKILDLDKVEFELYQLTEWSHLFPKITKVKLNIKIVKV